MQEFTYNSLKNLDSRQQMLQSDISSLGWQAGGFGVFNEQAKVLTSKGAESIASEVELMLISAKAGFDVSIEKDCPTLSKLVK